MRVEQGCGSWSWELPFPEGFEPSQSGAAGSGWGVGGWLPSACLLVMGRNALAAFSSVHLPH